LCANCLARIVATMSLSHARTEAVLAGLESMADQDLPTQELIEKAGAKLTQAVPASGVFMASTDPETTLCTGAGIVLDLPEAMCVPTWDYEYLVPDYIKFADLAEGPVHVADLHTATGGKPQRSARFREISAITGFVSEARMAFTAGGSAWGVAQFNRTDQLPHFAPDEIAFLEQAAPIIGRALRRAVLSETASATDSVLRGPGILVLDREGRLISISAEAEAWLAEVTSHLHWDLGFGVKLPMEAYAFAATNRAPEDAPVKPPRARLRTKDGIWLVIHASALRGAGDDTIALIVEPAKASEVAPIIVEAYGLTARELDVTRLIAKGLKTADIAARLHLSAHTVRDHLKAVFETVGVSSRGELVNQLYAEHYFEGTRAGLHANEPDRSEFALA
jgi:DNA-binding CsgD family transcriptional regulator